MQGLMNMVWEHLLPAIHVTSIPKNSAAHDALQRKLASLSLPIQPGANSSVQSTALSKQTYSFPPNEQEITRVEIDFSAEHPVIVFTDADGTHSIPCGVGQWSRSSTTFRKRISSLFDVPHQSIAASGAWTDEFTFTAKLCFTETPYTITATFCFEGDNLLLDMEHNLRWGETKRPRLIGSRSR
jgi:hypothetical protein